MGFQHWVKINLYAKKASIILQQENKADNLNVCNCRQLTLSKEILIRSEKAMDFEAVIRK